MIGGRVSAGIVRNTWRQIEHVAGLENPFARRAEARHDVDLRPRLRAQIALPTNPPSATPKRLQQKDIVGIHVRTYAAAIGGKAHHQIVEPGIRYETKARQQASCGIVEQIDAVHQQRPVCPMNRWQAKERAVLQYAAAIKRGDQPALRLLAPCELE